MWMIEHESHTSKDPQVNTSLLPPTPEQHPAIVSEEEEEIKAERTPRATCNDIAFNILVG